MLWPYGGSIKITSKEVGLIWLLFFVRMGIVAITWSDWDNRWLDRVTPLNTVLTAGGVVSLWTFLKAIGLSG